MPPHPSPLPLPTVRQALGRGMGLAENFKYFWLRLSVIKYRGDSGGPRAPIPEGSRVFSDGLPYGLDVL